MLFKDLWKIYHMASVKIYINGVLQETKSSWDYDQFNDYEVRRIAPCCESTGQLSLSKGITVEPYLEIHLNPKKQTISYEVERGKLNDINVEETFKFEQFNKLEDAEYEYGVIQCNEPKTYKCLWEITTEHGDEIKRELLKSEGRKGEILCFLNNC